MKCLGVLNIVALLFFGALCKKRYCSGQHAVEEASEHLGWFFLFFLFPKQTFASAQIIIYVSVCVTLWFWLCVEQSFDTPPYYVHKRFVLVVSSVQLVNLTARSLPVISASYLLSFILIFSLS